MRICNTPYFYFINLTSFTRAPISVPIYKNTSVYYSIQPIQSVQSVDTASRMTFQQKSFKLNTGAQIPAIGLGTWQDEDAQEAAVLAALNAGYRHIDTARWFAKTLRTLFRQ